MLSLQNFAEALCFISLHWGDCKSQEKLNAMLKEYIMAILEKGLLKTSIYHNSKQMIGKREGHQEFKKLLAIDERSEKDELRRLIVKRAEAN